MRVICLCPDCIGSLGAAIVSLLCMLTSPSLLGPPPAWIRKDDMLGAPNPVQFSRLVSLSTLSMRQSRARASTSPSFLYLCHSGHTCETTPRNSVNEPRLGGRTPDPCSPRNLPDTRTNTELDVAVALWRRLAC